LRFCFDSAVAKLVETISKITVRILHQDTRTANCANPYVKDTQLFRN